MIGLTLVTAPTAEPVSLSEAKLHLRLESEETSPLTSHPDDALIQALIETARDWAERFQNRAYITQTWRLTMDSFPADSFITLPRPPLQSLVSLSYWDGTTTQVVSFVDPSGTAILETDAYMVDTDSQPGRLCLKPGLAWPTIESRANAVQIEFVAGYGAAAAVPERIKAAIKLRLSELYENRGDLPIADGHKSAAELLLWLDRIVPI